MDKTQGSGRRVWGQAGIGAAIAAAAVLAGAAGARSSGESVNPPPAGPQGAAPASFATIVERVAPAVVSIDVEMAAAARPAAGPASQAPGDLRRFFGQGPRPSRPVRATGSGFFISPDGYLLTNNHVVEDARAITVRTHDERRLEAKVVGRDPETDLAVLKVQVTDAPYVDLDRRGNPRVGDWVVAVGSPFNLGGSATAGIVSALVRPRIGGSSYVDYMQIDAAINRGNSGGPTFDTAGRLVGVNTAIFSPTGGSVGIGFDIPAAVAAEVARQLIAEGEVVRGYIGATVQNVTREIAESLGQAAPTGALVAEVTPDGPADRAGLAPGDLILELDGTPVATATDLTRRVAAAKPGTSLRLKAERHGAVRAVTLRAGARPTPRQLAQATGATSTPGGGLGLALAPTGGAGLRVEAVRPGSDAQAVGVRPGDVLAAINGAPMRRPEDVEAAVTAAARQGRDHVLAKFTRGGRHRFLPLEIAPAGGVGEGR